MNWKTIIEDLFTHHSPSQGDISAMLAIREKAKELALAIVEHAPHSADRTTAIRKVREAVMTANASIVLKGMA